LKNAKADEIASTINSLASGASRSSSKRRKSHSVGSLGGVMFQGEVKVTADKSTNTLVVVASAKDYNALRKVIELLDLKRKQVYVEAVIMEISIDKNRDIGISANGGYQTSVKGNDVPMFAGSNFGDLSTMAVNPAALTGFAFGAMTTDSIKLTENTVDYAKTALSNLESSPLSLQEEILKNELFHFIPLVEKVIDQAVRRVINKEKVAATDKIFSIFEEHTDIIIKDRRDTYYGHKICLSGGASNLILDCQILAGNPADSTLTKEMLERQKDIYGRPPLKVALDGGFASQKNLEDAKGLGIKDVCFSKGRGMDIEDMCRSEYVYKCLRRFRAGIESGISWLKRAFGLTRCLWRGLESFKSYVWASIVSANLQTLARHRLA
jgi:IS5 family transposase